MPRPHGLLDSPAGRRPATHRPLRLRAIDWLQGLVITLMTVDDAGTIFDAAHLHGDSALRWVVDSVLATEGTAPRGSLQDREGDERRRASLTTRLGATIAGRMTKTITLVASLLALSSCVTPREGFLGGFNGGNPGIDQAAFDLDCPKDQISVVDLGEWRIGVKGCGKKTSYRNNAGPWSRAEDVTPSP